MKKFKILSTYLVAIICILSTLSYQPKEIGVFKTSTEKSDKIMIYMLDKEINEPFYSGTIEIGKKGVFYLDFRNRVTAVSYDSSILTNYAYLMGIDKKKNSFAPFQIKLFGADGKISVYTVAEKLKMLNDQRILVLYPQKSFSGEALVRRYLAIQKLLYCLFWMIYRF